MILEDGVTGGFGINQFSQLKTATYEEGIAEIKKVADRVHEGGAYIGTQVGIGNPMDPGDANAWTLEELHNIVKGYGEGALRLKQAGFDCIELKGATNDGLNQFVTRSKRPVYYPRRGAVSGKDTGSRRRGSCPGPCSYKRAGSKLLGNRHQPLCI